MNPKSAVERTKNHLAYKLGQEILKSNKRAGGGLLFRLLKIKTQHQKESKSYQQQILQSPQQKYPRLGTLNDYPQSLRIKNSLSYRLGEELINAYKFWWCGGFLYFALRIPSIRAEFRGSQEQKHFAKSLQEVKNQCNALRSTQILMRRALCDSKGVDFLNLCLQNASVPRQYYFIFYKMLYQKSLCNQSPICIDAGAHKGVVTDMILYCGGISYAFEPNCYLAEFLRNKYQDNPNVILYQNAVSDRNYTTQFLEYGLLSDGNRIVGGDTSKKAYDVEVLDLTEVILEILSQYSKIYFLKLDIEGAEFEIIDKIIALGLWKKIDYIACETHERFFADGEQKMQNLKRKIEENRIENILLDWV